MEADILGDEFERGNCLFLDRGRPIFDTLHQILDSLFHAHIIANYIPYSPSANPVDKKIADE